jgi:hypothetical protein
MSEVKVNKVSPRSGTGLQLGDSGDTLTIPSGATLDIASGATLTNNGTTTGFASIAWQSSIVTAATFTAVAGRGYWIDTSSNACTVTFPASASVGDQIILTDYARNWGTNAVTINQNGLNFQGHTSPNPVYDTDGESVDMVFSGATKGWIPNSDGAVVFETVQSYSANYLVVAGGAGGGRGNAGGGGAGGYLTNVGGASIALTPGVVYTVTVGNGGTGRSGSDNQGGAGQNSVLSGTGITTVTAIGGGGGGANGTSSGAGADGGSGGGANYNANGGSGTAPQGNDGGDGPGNGPAYGGGGGGGAAATGANGSGSGGGAGGDGNANTITGSSVSYAAGGGGSVDSSGTLGPGGTGGGGTGGNNSTNATAGTVNTGSGGGGSHQANSGAGGSGIVILSVADADYSGTTTGSPTVTTGVSGQTVIKFTGSGSYTA